METSILAWMPGPLEWVIIGIVALLIFGSRLPSVARSFGKSVVEFKKGLKDVKDDISNTKDESYPSMPLAEKKEENND